MLASRCAARAQRPTVAAHRLTLRPGTPSPLCQQIWPGRLRGITRQSVRGWSYSTATAEARKPASASAGFHLLLLVPCGITLGLGIWQIFRLEGKRTEISAREATLAKPSTPLLELLGKGGLVGLEAELRARVFERITLTGEFDHAAEAYVGARGMPGTDAETARGSGYVVLTPLRLADGTRVLVNRGWVERQYKDPRTRAAAQVVGPVTLETVARAGEHGAWYQPAGGRADRAWTWLDLEEIADATATRAGLGHAVLFDAVQEWPPHREELGQGGPIARDVMSYMSFPVTPFKHMIYAGTWFSLSVAIIAMYVTKVTPAGAFIRQRLRQAGFFKP